MTHHTSPKPFPTFRLDRGFSQLYQEMEKHTRALGDMMRHTNSILHVVPDVDALKSEVHNIVKDLPRGTLELCIGEFEHDACQEPQCANVAPRLRQGVFTLRDAPSFLC